MAASTSISAQTRKKINLLPGVLDTVSEHDKEITRINKFLFEGDVERNEPSLVERIRNIEKIVQTLGRLAWIATSSVVGLLVIYAWESFVK